jgi:hypothetical protein
MSRTDRFLATDVDLNSCFYIIILYPFDLHELLAAWDGYVHYNRPVYMAGILPGVYEAFAVRKGTMK